jgi:hypothetical protein
MWYRKFCRYIVVFKISGIHNQSQKKGEKDVLGNVKILRPSVQNAYCVDCLGNSSTFIPDGEVDTVLSVRPSFVKEHISHEIGSLSTQKSKVQVGR